MPDTDGLTDGREILNSYVDDTKRGQRSPRTRIHLLRGSVKDTRTIKPGFYTVPPQNIFEISLGFQLQRKAEA